MPVISGGNVISGGVVLEGGAPTLFYGSGAPTAGTTYDGQIAVGDVYVDVDTGNLYEYTEPTSTPTYTRIDTV